MKDESVIVGLSVTVGFLALAGLGAGAYYLLKKQPIGSQMALPSGQGGGLAVGNGVVAQVGSGGAWDAIAKMQAEQAAKEAEWRKQDKIRELQTALASAQNEIKRQTDQLNVLDGSPVPADIVTQVSLRHEQDCLDAKKWWQVGWNCAKSRDLSDGYDKKADAAWAAKKVELKRPILTRLSELNSQQLDIIANLRDLGVTVQPVSVRTS